MYQIYIKSAMKKILFFALIVGGLLFVHCGRHIKKAPFLGNYSVELDLSYIDTSSSYMQMYVLLATMVDSANAGDLIPYRISFEDSSLISYYSDDQTFSYNYTYTVLGEDYYQLVLDRRDTVDLEVQDDSTMLMVFPDNMAFLLMKEK